VCNFTDIITNHYVGAVLYPRVIACSFHELHMFNVEPCINRRKGNVMIRSHCEFFSVSPCPIAGSAWRTYMVCQNCHAFSLWFVVLEKDSASAQNKTRSQSAPEAIAVLFFMPRLCSSLEAKFEAFPPSQRPRARFTPSGAIVASAFSVLAVMRVI
jgi:hypothetical protein